MDIDLVQTQKARQKIMKRIKSGKWWLILSYNPQTENLIVEVEDKYFTGNVGEDFELAVVPQGITHPSQPRISVALFHKRRMSAEQLAEMLADAGTEVSGEDLQRRDILCPGDPKTSSMMVRLFFSWLQRPKQN